MKYASSELLSRLSAEYVLGTLRGAARRRFERLLASSEEARRQTQWWRDHLAPALDNTAGLKPPARIRAQLLGSALPPPYRRRILPGAQIFLSGLAAGIVLAAALGMHLARTRGAGQEQGAGMPIYLSQVGIPLSSMQWLVSESADRRRFVVVAGGEFPQLGRHRIELWCLDPASAAPIRLGNLPVEAGVTVQFDLPRRLHGEADVRFAISLEPDHAEQSRPQGPVLDIRAALDQI